MESASPGSTQIYSNIKLILNQYGNQFQSQWCCVPKIDIFTDPNAIILDG